MPRLQAWPARLLAQLQSSGRAGVCALALIAQPGGQSQSNDIGSLAEALSGQDPGALWSAAWEIGELAAARTARGTNPPWSEEDLGPATDALVELAGADDPQLRWVALRALGRLGAPRERARELLVGAVGDEDLDVRWAAVEAMGHVTRLDSTADSGLREALARALDDASPSVRAAAAGALARRGAPLGADVAARLIQLARSPAPGASTEERRAAATALARCATEVPAFAAFVDDLTAERVSHEARVTAAMALAGASGTLGLAELSTAAEGADRELARAALASLAWRAERDSKRLTESATPDEDLAHAGRRALEPSAGEPPVQPATEVAGAADPAPAPAPAPDPAPDPAPASAASAPQDARPAPAEIGPEHGSFVAPFASVWNGLGRVLLVLLCVPQLVALVLWLTRPAALFALSAFARRRLGRASPFLLSPLWLRSRRALDAWISAREAVVAQNLAQHPLLGARAVHVAPPARIGRTGRIGRIGRIGHEHEREHEEEHEHELTSARLGARLARAASPHVAIVGEGGSGKTNLAVHVALASLSHAALQRPFGRAVLPVLLDDERSLAAFEDRQSGLELFRAALESLTGEPVGPDEVEALVRSARLLVVIDGLSEMSALARARAGALARTFPALPLVVTTRPSGRPSGWAGLEVHPEPLAGSGLAHFVDRYLAARLGRASVPDVEFFEGCAGLVRLAHGRPVSALVASLWAELWIERTSEAARGEVACEPPRSVFELFGGHARLLARRGSASTADLEEDLVRLAELAIGSRLYPAPFSEADAVQQLCGPSPASAAVRGLREARARLEELVAARILLRPRAPEGDPISPERSAARAELAFVLDPLAESFAAEACARRAGESLALWRELIDRCRRAAGAPTRVAGFLHALGDCVVARRPTLGAATWKAVQAELGLCADAPPVDTHGPRRALAQLESAVVSERLAGLAELGRLGEATLAYAPEVARLLDDGSAEVRAAAVDLCVGWRSRAVPTLVACLEQQPLSSRARTAVFAALTRLGPDAAEAVPALSERVAGGGDLRATLAVLRAIGKAARGACSAICAAWEGTEPGNLARRREILQTLGAVGDAHCVPLLVSALDSPEHAAAAAAALAELGPEARSAVPALCARLEAVGERAVTGGETLALASISTALSTIGDASQNVVRALERAATCANELVADAARRALAELRQATYLETP